MREQMFKWIGVLLALCLFALSGAANAQAVVTQKDLSHQKENLQLQIDQQKELLQKDIQTKNQEFGHVKGLVDRQDKRIADIDAHINRFEVLLATFGILITIALGLLVYVGFVTVKAQVGEQSQNWFDENAKKLQIQISDLEVLVEGAKSKMTASVDKVEETGAKVRNAMESIGKSIGDNKPVKAEYEKPIVEQAAQLKYKPESSYSYDDWNTRAFDAWINKKFGLAVEYWEQAASVPEIGKANRADVLLRQGPALGELGRGEDEIAAYDRLINDFGNDEDSALRERVAIAMFNKGVALGELEHSDDAIAVYDRLIKDYGGDKEPALRERVAGAMVNKGVILGSLERYEEAIAVYDRVIAHYGNNENLILRELVADAMNNKGYALLLQAKSHWGDAPLRQDLLTQANDSFEQAIQWLPNNAVRWGNSAYCAWLLGRTEFAEEQFKKALGADGGGETLYEATLKDLVINPVDVDQGFRDLIHRLYKSYQGKG